MVYRYSGMLQRSFHKGIIFENDFHCVNGATHSSKKAFQNAQEAKRVTGYFLSGHHYAHAGIPFRGEYGFFKLGPYITKTIGPYGRKICDTNSKTSKTIDQGFASIFWLNEERIPAPSLAKLLEKIWSDREIDSNMPAWLWDRRLENYVRSETKLYNCLLGKDANAILNCRWEPLKITKRLIEERNHGKYCSLVLRAFKLESIRAILERQVKNLKKKETDYVQKKETYNLAISKIMEWQGTMVGLMLYITASGRFTNEELLSDFQDSRLSTYDEGLHWTMHLGELHNVSALMRDLPFFSPVEKRSQKQRRIRGQQTDAGSIGDMRGTFFEYDKYISNVMNSINRGMVEPNKIRRVETVFTEGLRKMYGIPAGKEYTWACKKKQTMKTKISEIEQLCYAISINLKLIKHGEENIEIQNETIGNIEQLMKFKKHQILKSWKMKSDFLDYKKLIENLQILVDFGIPVDEPVSETIKAFMGPSPSSIPDIIGKMNHVINDCWSLKKYDNINESILMRYATKIISFNDFILKKYLSRDFKGELLKEIRKELTEIVSRKWSPLGQITPTMRRFLRCNIDNQVEIQNEKISPILYDEDDLNITNDENNEYSTIVRRKKGRAKQDNYYVPTWSGAAQKKVVSGEAKIMNPHGGHNAHRFLDFIMRMFAVSLLGCYPKSEFHPSFETITEIYKFIQFDYPSVEEFCIWIETILPFDVKFLHQKKEKYLESLLKEKLVCGKTGEEIFDSETIHKIYQAIDSKEGSQSRRWFIIYILREHHIFFVEENPSLHEIISGLYQWEMITNNIRKTMDINRNLIDDVICDLKIHEKTCIKNKQSVEKCKHCDRWRYVLSHFHPKLIEIYKKWPILFAIDFACQAQSDKDLDDKKEELIPRTSLENQDQNRNIFFRNNLKFSMIKGSSTSTFNGNSHTELLDFSPRPLMRTFEQNVVEQLSEIEHKLSDPLRVWEHYTTTKKRENVKYNEVIYKLSEQAVEEYKYASDNFMKFMHESVETIVKEVISKFRPNSKIGLEWMVPLFKLNFSTIRYIEQAREMFEKEQSRTLALKMLLKILGENPQDFFILRTYYNMIAHYNRIKVFPTTEKIMKNTINSITEKVKNVLDEKTETLPKHLINFYSCHPHGTMQAAMVGSELGLEGEKNTRSYGNDNLTVNPYDGHVYCTISGKRMEKKDGDDISWSCTNRPNTKINMLGRILQIYDVLYTMCEYCGNIMIFKWERVCAGGPDMWCGQCVRGQKKQAESLGYQWLSSNSLSPCTRPIFVGGCPTFVQRCVICFPTPKSVPETLTYYLMWIDTDPSGYAFLGYVPVCNTHKRNYHMENWEMAKLSQFTFFSQNQFRSYIIPGDGKPIGSITDNKILPPASHLNVDNLKRYFYHNTPSVDQYRLNRSHCEPTPETDFDKSQRRYLLEKQDDREQNTQIDDLVKRERKRGRPPRILSATSLCRP